jgi:hypothetical protein
MTGQSIKESAKAYVPKQTKNISELPVVSVDLLVQSDEGQDKDGKKFNYDFIEVNGERYRVPGKVLNDLKQVLIEKPNLKTFKVKKQGAGLNTQYTVIQLD